MTEQDRRWLTVPEAAARLGVNARTAYRLVGEGVLPALRLGVKRPQYRIAVAALEQLEAAMGAEARQQRGDAGADVVGRARIGSHTDLHRCAEPGAVVSSGRASRCAQSSPIAGPA